MEKVVILNPRNSKVKNGELEEKVLEVTIITDYLDQQDRVREILINNEALNKSNTIIHTTRPSNYQDLADKGYHILCVADYNLEMARGYALSLNRNSDSVPAEESQSCQRCT